MNAIVNGEMCSGCGLLAGKFFLQHLHSDLFALCCEGPIVGALTLQNTLTKAAGSLPFS